MSGIVLSLLYLLAMTVGLARSDQSVIGSGPVVPQLAFSPADLPSCENAEGFSGVDINGVCEVREGWRTVGEVRQTVIQFVRWPGCTGVSRAWLVRGWDIRKPLGPDDKRAGIAWALQAAGIGLFDLRGAAVMDGDPTQPDATTTYRMADPNGGNSLWIATFLPDQGVLYVALTEAAFAQEASAEACHRDFLAHFVSGDVWPRSFGPGFF